MFHYFLEMHSSISDELNRLKYKRCTVCFITFWIPIFLINVKKKKKVNSFFSVY